MRKVFLSFRTGLLVLALLTGWGAGVCLAQQANAASVSAASMGFTPMMWVDLHAHPDKGPVSQEFVFDFECPCVPTNAVFNFGDGQSITTRGEEANHTYAAPGTYTATVSVTGMTEDGSREGFDSVVVIVQPDYFFVTATATPNTGPAPLTPSFTADTLGGKKPFTYLWNFGDGQTSAQPNPSHTYGRMGSYTVRLTVTDSRGWAASATTTVFVAMTAIGVQTAATPTEGYAPLGVHYSASASGGTPPYTFSWRFSNGSTATGATASVTYSAPGSYTAGITVTDSTGNWTVTGAPTVNVYPKMPSPGP